MKTNKTKEPPPQNKQSPKVMELSDGECPSYYANHAEIRLSPWDFRLTLGEVKEVKEGEVTVKALATVYMSPGHAKIFSEVLAQKVAQFEEKIGPIPMPARDPSEQM